MPIQKIVPKSQESLRETDRVVDFEDPYVRCAIEDLFDTLRNQQAELDKLHPGFGGGVGLASNQIEYPEPRYPKNFTPPCIYVMSIRPVRAAREKCDVVLPTVYINARYEKLAESAVKEYPEGCLSINGVQGLNVPRDTAILVIANDCDGNEIRFEARDFIARVHQHEQDHCHGHEYINQLDYTQDELEQLKGWIEQNRASPAPAKGTMIVRNLICTGDPLDYDALAAWVEGQRLAPAFGRASP